LTEESIGKFFGIKVQEELNEDKIDWTFREANVRKHVHGIHPYPARMVPQAVEKLIKIYGTKASEEIGHDNWAIFDPFCGSGTVLVEGRILNYNVYGTDINPLAVLLANAKSTPIPRKDLNRYWRMIKTDYKKSWRNKEYSSIPNPDIPRLEFWFKDNVIQKLKVIRKQIWELEENNVDQKIVDFFKLCFSIIVRKVSNNRQGEFKIYRIKKEDLEKWNPDVFSIFDKKVEDSISRMAEYYQQTRNEAITEAYLANSMEFIPPEPVGLIITSPHYGDHKTTVAYGQFSRYSSYWLGYEKDLVSQVDNSGLGGKSKKVDIETIDFTVYGSEALKETIAAIIKGDKEATQKKLKREKEKATREQRKSNPKVKSDPRVYSVLVFFQEYFQVIVNLYEILQPGGYACFVTGNRTVREYRIPTHEITREFCQKVGFTYIKTLERFIPTKTMPWENSPSNVAGDKVRTMATEHIVILKKPND